MKKSIYLAVMAASMFINFSCTSEPKNVAVIGVDFDWQRMDYGSEENPKILLTGVPTGTKRFFVCLEDLDLKMYDHGGGFVDNDGTGVIARGAVKGNYNGPAPPWPDMIHNYEITVKAYDANGAVIGIGKSSKEFLYGN